MKTLIFLLSLISINPSALAQNQKKWNRPNPIQCLKDHRAILKDYEEQISSEAIRILDGIRYEKANQTPDYAIRSYEQLAGKIFVKQIMTQTLVEQINTAIKKFSSLEHPEILFSSRNILSTKNIRLDRRLKLNRALDELTHEYIRELLVEAGVDLGKGIYHSMGTSFLKGVTAASIGKASLSFGVDVVKGAGISFLLNLITKPLKGARLPPETIWVEILESNPGLILNPEWMNEAGSPDAPWMTHCLSLERKRNQVMEALENLVSNEESLFKNEILKINETLKPVQPKIAAPADHTYVVHPKSMKSDASEIPFWAINH